jgi:hypothetical protein
LVKGSSVWEDVLISVEGVQYDPVVSTGLDEELVQWLYTLGDADPST